MSNNPTTSNMSGAGVPMKTEISHARVRTTPNTSFAKVAGDGLKATGNVLAASSRIMAPMLPGGAVLSAAINGAGAVKSAASGAGSAGMMSSGSLNGHVVQPANRDPAGAGGSFGDALPAVDANNPYAAGKEMLNMQASNNMQYIMLQAGMQSENRNFTTVSNVMKTRHDTQKNAINNVR